MMAVLEMPNRAEAASSLAIRSSGILIVTIFDGPTEPHAAFLIVGFSGMTAIDTKSHYESI